jgi:hypothetical protein
LQANCIVPDAGPASLELPAAYHAAGVPLNNALFIVTQVVDVSGDKLGVSLTLDMDPTFLAIGPRHAAAGINNQVQLHDDLHLDSLIC